MFPTTCSTGSHYDRLALEATTKHYVGIMLTNYLASPEIFAVDPGGN